MTVLSRKFRATPVRSASEVWNLIVDLLAPQRDSNARKEISAVSGIAQSLIADEAMRTAPLVVAGSGPRLRLYCLYDEDAIIGEAANENALTFDATAGDWSISIPAPLEDLEWVQESLKKVSKRITARDMAKGIDIEEAKDNQQKKMVLDEEAFFRS